MNLCGALESAGHEIIVVHADPVASLPPSGVSHRFYVERFDQFGSEHNLRRSTSRVIEILEAVKPDIVHTQGNNNFLLEEEIRRRFPAVKSLHVYDFCPSGNKFHHVLGKACQYSTGPLCVARMGYKRCILSMRPSVIWWHYRRCVEANRNNARYLKLIVASQYVKQQAMTSGYPASQIEVVPYFTELPVISPTVDNGGKTILFVGRVVREKGLDHLLAALSMVRSPSRLIVAGDGPDLGRAKRLAHRLGVDGRTTFVGWIDKDLLIQFYREVSVVVIPSLWPEPFGIVGLEAMSFAKAVVAFKVGGIPEWLEDGVTGILVKPYDVKELAEKISYLLEHKDKANDMGRRGRKKAEDEFNEEKHVTRLLGIYQGVNDGHLIHSTMEY